MFTAIFPHQATAGNPYWTGRLSTVDLLLRSLDQLLFKLKILFTFHTKLGALLWRSIVLSLPLQLVFPGRSTLLSICWYNYTAMTLLHNGFTRFSLYLKTEFFVDLKRSSFWPSCDVRSLSNDLLHAMPWQCMLSLSKCILPRNPYQEGSVQMTSSSFYLPFQINYF